MISAIGAKESTNYLTVPKDCRDAGRRLMSRAENRFRLPAVSEKRELGEFVQREDDGLVKNAQRL